MPSIAPDMGNERYPLADAPESGEDGKNGENDEQTSTPPTKTTTTTATPTATIGTRVRALTTRVLPSRTTVIAWGYYVLFMALGIMGPAAAAKKGANGVGKAICGTPIADAINKLAPLALGAVVIGGLILAYLLHAYSGFKKDPEQVRYIKEWRTRAAITAISAPLLGYLLEMVIGFMGLGLASCIDIVPGLK